MRFFVIAYFLIVASPAIADELAIGNKAFSDGFASVAMEHWSKSKKPEAAYNIGYAAERGAMLGCDPIYCASSWYLKSANMGHVPSIMRLGVLNYNNGFRELGIEMLTKAALAGNTDAKEILQIIAQANIDSEREKDRLQTDITNQQILAQQQELIRQQRALLEQKMTADAIGDLGYGLGCLLGGGSCGAPSHQTRTQPPSPMICRSMGAIGNNPAPYRCQ